MAKRSPEAAADASAAKITSLNRISLLEPDIDKSVSLLKQACLDSGFFYVVDHGIDQKLMEEVFAQSKKLFDLPLDEKMKLLRNKKNRGYTPTLDETLDPDNQISVMFGTMKHVNGHLISHFSQGDYKEGYYIGIEVSEDDPQAEKPFYGPNLWPPADILPGWRETMEGYHKEALYTTVSKDSNK